MAFKVIAIAIALSIHLRVFCVLGRTTHQQTIANISKEEDLDFDTELEILNKPGVAEFTNDYGDTYDCVPIIMQPSLDHPLLKNHTIQVPPNIWKTTVEPDSYIIRSDHNCPEGSVPIRRNTKEDLIRTQSFLINYIRIFDRTNRFFFAGIQTKNVDKRIYRGAQAFLTIHKPSVYGSNQFSGAVITIRRGPEWIIVGWMVNPTLYGGDNSTRAFTMWLGKGSKPLGCYNTNCLGFVYTQNSIVLDQVFDTRKPNSTSKGFSVQQDEQGNWWLGVGDGFDPVGYWPKELFNELWKGADYIEMGGQVYTGENDKVDWPQMGTGVQFSYNNQLLKASMYHILLINDKYIATIPDADGALVEAHQEHCYLVKDNSFKGDTANSSPYIKGYSFQYTGTGGKNIECRASRMNG